MVQYDKLLLMKRSKQGLQGNRTYWALLCVFITLLFLSGQMWNHIRRPPFITANRHTKEPTYIDRSYENQLVAETYIVAALYAAIAFGFILLNEAATPRAEVREKKTPKPFFGVKNNVLAYIGLSLVAIFFLLLSSIFRSKYRSYPYAFMLTLL